MVGGQTLTLKQFMLRQQVLKLYRNCFKTLRQIPDSGQRADLESWVRADFKANKGISPDQEDRIKSLMFNGEKMLNELRQSVELAKA